MGTDKLVSVHRELDGKPEPQPQIPPQGNLVMTPKVYVLFFTDGARKYGNSDAEKAALWGTMTAHAGGYRIDGKRIVMLPDTSNEILNSEEKTGLSRFKAPPLFPALGNFIGRFPNYANDACETAQDFSDLHRRRLALILLCNL